MTNLCVQKSWPVLIFGLPVVPLRFSVPLFRSVFSFRFSVPFFRSVPLAVFSQFPRVPSRFRFFLKRIFKEGSIDRLSFLTTSLPFDGRFFYFSSPVCFPSVFSLSRFPPLTVFNGKRKKKRKTERAKTGVQCNQLFARDRAEREHGHSKTTAALLSGLRKKLKFAIKSETRLQSVFDFEKFDFWVFWNFGREWI